MAATPLKLWRTVYGLIGLLLLAGSTGFVLLTYRPSEAYSGIILILAVPFFVVGFFLAMPFVWRSPLGRNAQTIVRGLSWVFLLAGLAGSAWMILEAGGDGATILWALAYFALPGLLLMDAYRRWSGGE